MSLLRGILDSKGRRAVWERNNEAAPLAPELPPARLHNPKPGPDNTLLCCGQRYSPAAHLLHTRAERIATACGEVRVSGLDDPWIDEQDKRLKAARNETPADDEAIKRTELIELYYQKQGRRGGPRKVDGASTWMAD